MQYRHISSSTICELQCIQNPVLQASIFPQIMFLKFLENLEAGTGSVFAKNGKIVNHGDGSLTTWGMFED
jgi:hypothetical protein